MQDKNKRLFSTFTEENAGLIESLLSVLSEKQHIKEGYSEKIKNAPKDTVYFCYIFFFSVGFMTLMPMVFLGTAANYWMYKFRNVNATSDDAAHRTSLQSLYQSSSMVATTVPNVILTLLTTIYGKNFDSRKLSLCSLIAIFAIFFTFLVFTRIDTDSWQGGFFAMTMILIGINSYPEYMFKLLIDLLIFIFSTIVELICSLPGPIQLDQKMKNFTDASLMRWGAFCAALAIYQLSVVTILAKFPNNFMKLYLLGQSGGILTDVLQVISISVTDSDSDGALIYFSTGTILIAMSICLTIGIKYTKTYAYYSEYDSDENGNEANVSWPEMTEVARMIWPVLSILLIVIFSMTCIHPSVTSLVASQHNSDGGAWEKKYFTPVITFLLADVSSMMGRIASRGKISRSNFPFWLAGIIIRTIASVGFVIFCNAQPRNHLPVVFHEDWIFILWGILYHMSGGFIMNILFLSLHELSGGKSEVALKLVSIIFSVAGAIFSANGIIVVKLL